MTTIESVNNHSRHWSVGFAEIVWPDSSTSGACVCVCVMPGRLEALTENGAPPTGIHLLLGSDAQTMAEATLNNLEEGGITVAYGVPEPL